MVDGDRLLELVFQAMYDPTAIALVPRLVDGIAAGRTDTLRDLLERFLPQYGLFAEGAYYAIHCADEVAFATVAEARADAEAVDPGPILVSAPPLTSCSYRARRDRLRRVQSRSSSGDCAGRSVRRQADCRVPNPWASGVGRGNSSTVMR